MGKGFILPEQKKMNVSQDLLWGMLKNRNCFMHKQKKVCFTSDKFSVDNKHSFSNLGLINKSNLNNFVDNGDNVTMVQEHHRRFVNKGLKSKRRTLRTGAWSSMMCHDKNAAKRASKCPKMSARVKALHQAHCRRLQREKAVKK